MSDYLEKFQSSIDYMEAHLTDTLDIASIAAVAAMSSFYYQRIFGVLCGMTVGEYIRGRRMTCAALELASSDARVLDVALRYGYDSPDSFARAFSRFHGIAPSRAREKGAPLRSMAPLHIRMILEGGNMLDYRIVERAPFTVVGLHRTFDADTAYEMIPGFWAETMAAPCPVQGLFGLCVEHDAGHLDYWICDLYKPWEDLPEGCDTFVLPGSFWAQFICRGPLPESLQQVNTRIWSEWLPALKGYTLAGNYSLECYMPPAARAEDTVNYIWIPLKKE